MCGPRGLLIGCVVLAKYLCLSYWMSTYELLFIAKVRGLTTVQASIRALKMEITRPLNFLVVGDLGIICIYVWFTVRDNTFVYLLFFSFCWSVVNYLGLWSQKDLCSRNTINR